MMGQRDEPVTQLNITADELRTLAFAMDMFNTMLNVAPIVDHPLFNSSRSDRIHARRSAHQFNERIQSLAKAYGIEV